MGYARGDEVKGFGEQRRPGVDVVFAEEPPEMGPLPAEQT
jgi:hypothetical protein